MKLEPDFDDEFQPKAPRTCGRVRSISRLMIVVAACGLALAVMVGMGKHKRNARGFPARLQRSVQAPPGKALSAQARDAFVVVAAAEIDAEMVIPAPAGIDEAMVFNPYTRERASRAGAAAPDPLLTPLPGNPSGQVPRIVHPPPSLPQRPAPTQPR